MTSREWDRAYAEASGDWSEYVKKWRGDMTERMAIVPMEPEYNVAGMSGAGAGCLPSVDGVTGFAGALACDVYKSMIAASPHAGKLSQAQITAAIEAMKDCGLPYMPWQRREIIVQIVAKSFGLEIE